MGLRLASAPSEVIDPLRTCCGFLKVEYLAVGLWIQSGTSLEMLQARGIAWKGLETVHQFSKSRRYQFSPYRVESVAVLTALQKFFGSCQTFAQRQGTQIGLGQGYFCFASHFIMLIIVSSDCRS